jgi:cytochrome c peroxidase
MRNAECGICNTLSDCSSFRRFGLWSVGVDLNPHSPTRVALGKQLFFDPRLSGDNSVSCASCHLPRRTVASACQFAKSTSAAESTI